MIADKNTNNTFILSDHWPLVRCQKGVAALLTIVIIGAATLIMAFTASLLGLGELEMGYDSQQGAEALSLADGCMDETLRHLRLDSSYSGDTLSLGDGSCIIGVSSNGVNRIISVTSTIGNYNKVIQMDIDIDANSVITVNSWEEL